MHGYQNLFELLRHLSHLFYPMFFKHLYHLIMLNLVEFLTIRFLYFFLQFI